MSEQPLAPEQNDAIKIDIETVQSVSVITAVGNIDSNTAQAVEEKVLPLAVPGGKLLFNLAGVPYMSSAGLRILLVIYRQVTCQSGRVVLAGLSDDLKDMMDATGFLTFFMLADNVEAGL